MDLFSEMGDMFSKLQKFHDAGEEPNTNNVEYFGTPKYSLYTAQDIIDLHQRIDITDDQGNLKCIIPSPRSSVLHLRRTSWTPATMSLPTWSGNCSALLRSTILRWPTAENSL